MPSATVSPQSQITIPPDVVRTLDLQAGDRLEFVQVDPGEFLLFAVNRSVVELKGVFGKPATAVSVDVMNEVIAARGADAGER